jgi:hypothetical protein
LVVKLWCSSAWKFGENSIQSGVLGTVLSRSACTARHRVAPRHVARAHRATPRARTLRQPTTRRSVRSGTARVEPPSRPSPIAPRAHARRAGQPTASPPYARSAAPGWLLAVAARTVLAPCRNPLGDDSRDPLHKARAPIKELTSPPRALCPHRAAIAAVGGAPGELHLRLPFFANTCCSSLHQDPL